MQLYLLSQTFNDDYDTYDSAVVRAKSPEAAKLIHPGGVYTWKSVDPNSDETPNYGWLQTWAPPSQIKVEHLGPSTSSGPPVVCASFNAG